MLIIADVTPDEVACISTVLAQLDNSDQVSFQLHNQRKLRAELTFMQIARYSRRSRPLSVVRFRCMLQDTGYPLEVYMPGEASSSKEGERDKVDWSRLKERWVGWAVESVD